MDIKLYLRDRSLITGRGYTRDEGGKLSFTPKEKKKGGGGSFSHAEGGWGVTKSFGVVLTQEIEVLAILKVGGKKFSPYKVVVKGFNCLEGGVQKVSVPRFSHFLVPPP